MRFGPDLSDLHDLLHPGVMAEVVPQLGEVDIEDGEALGSPRVQAEAVEEPGPTAHEPGRRLGFEGQLVEAKLVGRSLVQPSDQGTPPADDRREDQGERDGAGQDREPEAAQGIATRGGRGDQPREPSRRGRRPEGRLLVVGHPSRFMTLPHRTGLDIGGNEAWPVRWAGSGVETSGGRPGRYQIWSWSSSS